MINCYASSYKGLIQKYEKDIKALKEELAMQDLLHNKANTKSVIALTENQIADIREGVKQYISGDAANIEVKINCRHDINKLIVQ